MTNEEIEKRASEAFAKSLQAAHRGDESEIVGNIAEAIREAVSQAYEEAAMATCEECGWYGTRHLRRLNEWQAVDEMHAVRGYAHGQPGWLALPDTPETYTECKAAAIYALKDSLVPESVSS